MAKDTLLGLLLATTDQHDDGSIDTNTSTDSFLELPVTHATAAIFPPGCRVLVMAAQQQQHPSTTTHADSNTTTTTTPVLQGIVQAVGIQLNTSTRQDQFKILLPTNQTIHLPAEHLQLAPFMPVWVLPTEGAGWHEGLILSGLSSSSSSSSSDAGSGFVATRYYTVRALNDENVPVTYPNVPLERLSVRMDSVPPAIPGNVLLGVASSVTSNADGDSSERNLVVNHTKQDKPTRDARSRAAVSGQKEHRSDSWSIVVSPSPSSDKEAGCLDTGKCPKKCHDGRQPSTILSPAKKRGYRLEPPSVLSMPGTKRIKTDSSMSRVFQLPPWFGADFFQRAILGDDCRGRAKLGDAFHCKLQFSGTSGDGTDEPMRLHVFGESMEDIDKCWNEVIKALYKKCSLRLRGTLMYSLVHLNEETPSSSFVGVVQALFNPHTERARKEYMIALEVDRDLVERIDDLLDLATDWGLQSQLNLNVENPGYFPSHVFVSSLSFPRMRDFLDEWNRCMGGIVTLRA